MKRRGRKGSEEDPSKGGAASLNQRKTMLDKIGLNNLAYGVALRPAQGARSVCGFSDGRRGTAQGGSPWTRCVN